MTVRNIAKSIMVSLFIAAPLLLSALTGEEIIQRMESNQVHKTSRSEGSMTITDIHDFSSLYGEFLATGNDPTIGQLGSVRFGEGVKAGAVEGDLLGAHRLLLGLQLIAQRHQLIGLGDDPLLLGQRRDRDTLASNRRCAQFNLIRGA